MKNRINVAAINRSLAVHGESVGHGQLVDRHMPAYYDGNALNLFVPGDELPRNLLQNSPLLARVARHEHFADVIGVCDEDVAAINRSLALHGEAFDFVDHEDGETDAINRSLALHGEAI